LRPIRSPISAALALLAVLATASPALGGHAGKVRMRSFELLNEGVSAYNRGEYAVAVEKLRQSSSMALNSFRAYYYLGLALIGDRRYVEAIETLNVALDLDPSHLRSLVALGDASLRLGDTEEARAAYYRALKLRPGYAPSLDGVARSYEAQSKLDQAIEHYRKAILSDKGFAPAYAHLGDLYLEQGRMADAIRLLEQAISVRPNYAPGMNRLALAYGRLGLNNEAVATIHEAIELEPHSARHVETLGRLQLGQGLLTQAEESFYRALDLDPALPGARLGLADVARRHGDYDEAMAQIETALEDPRLDAVAQRRLNEFLVAVELESTRLGELTDLVESGEATPEENSEMAEIFAGRGEWERAVELQREAPDSDDARERLAYFLFQAGQYREAHTVYADLTERTDDLRLAINSGVTLALLGDDEAALDAYDRVLEIKSDSLLAQLYIGNAHLRLGRRDEAIDAYKRFLDGHSQGASAERVRRILMLLAPDLLPPEDDEVLPPAAPPPPQEDAS